MCNDQPNVSSRDDATRRRNTLPVVHVERPRCPTCSSPFHRKYRSVTDLGDETAMCWVKCSYCGQRFKVVLE